MTFLIAYSSLALLILAYGLWQASSLTSDSWEKPDYEEILNERVREWRP